MPNRIPDVITTCTPEEMFQAIGTAWVNKFGGQPKTESILVLLCQWTLETGWGKSCHCWNIGNFKSQDGDGYDFVYYKCDERFSPQIAQHYLSSAGVRSDGTGLPNVVLESNNKDGTVSLFFWPDNSVSRFRAFNDINAGVSDYLNSLYNRFHLAWPAILAGDPDSFVHQLKIQGYFTADEATYAKTEDALFNGFKNKNFDLNNPPILSDADREQLQGLIADTIDDGSTDYTTEHGIS